jgi:uncharacterized protein
VNILIVDGYNIIGSWPELQRAKERDLEEARDILISKMAEYQGHTGYRVIIVFDAYYVQGTEKKMKQSRVEVIFTKKNQTADERIEQLAISLRKVNTQIYVATSDYTEQWAIFGQGALRKSARELLIEMEVMEKSISRHVKKTNDEKSPNRRVFSDKVTEMFEKMRRGKQ